MKWAYSIQQKFKAALLLAVVCAIVILTNLLGRYQMSELSNSFSSVIKDRLVVESYIYMISDHLHRKKLTLNSLDELGGTDISFQVNSHNESIEELLSLYDKTLLTDEEAVYLKDLKTNIATLEDLELQGIKSISNGMLQRPNLTRLNEQYSLAADNLFRLSQIQLKEGNMLNEQSQNIVNSSYLLNSFEMVVLVCIAIIIQIIVLASRPVISRIWQQSSMN